jgi:hypothetical protein
MHGCTTGSSAGFAMRATTGHRAACHSHAARFSRAVVIPAPRHAIPIVVGRDFPKMVSAAGKIELSRRRDKLPWEAVDYEAGSNRSPN